MPVLYIEITVTNIEVPVTSLVITTSSDFTMNFDETLQLGFNFEPYNATNPTVIWEVIDGTGTASVDETGLVSEAGEGNITVKISAADGSEITAEQEVTVTRMITDPESVAISGPAKIYGIGLSAQLTALWTPENTTWKSLTWVSGNESIATVDEKTGLVTAVGPGSVTVTASSDSTAGITASKEITVVEKQVVSMKWDFNNDLENWANADANNVTPVWSEDGSMKIEVTGGGGNLYNQFNATMFSTADCNYLVMRVKNETPANLHNMHFWVLPAEGNAFTRYVGLPVTPNSTEYETVIINLNEAIADLARDWKIYAMRIDPTVESGALYVDYIHFISNLIPAGSVSVSGPEYLEIGSAAQISAEVLPEGTTVNDVVFSVDDEAIATIDPKTGMLTAVSAGDVTVTATSFDNPEISGQALVKVVSEIVLVSSIEVTGESTIKGIGVQEQYSATVAPENAMNAEVIYSVSDNSIAEIDSISGVLTTLSVGDVTVTATAKDGSGVTGELLVTVDFGTAVLSPKEGIAEIYPNPVPKGRAIYINAQYNKVLISCTMTDIQGKIVFNGVFRGLNSAVISTGNLNSGLYILSVLTNEGQDVRRLIVK